jgi:hypothetical protein
MDLFLLKEDQYEPRDSQSALVRRYGGLIGEATLPIMQRMVGAAHSDHEGERI